jgi:hypothetical protein
MRMTCSGPIARFLGLSSRGRLFGLASCGIGRPRSFFSGDEPAGTEGSRSRKRAGLGERNERAGLAQRSSSDDDRNDAVVWSAGDRLESVRSNESGEWRLLENECAG